MSAIVNVSKAEKVDYVENATGLGVEAAPDEHDAQGLQRHLGNRQIQLIAIGGTIGTALFISIGSSLARGGPASLLISWTIYSCMLALVNNSIAEMTTAYPVSGGFVRLAGKWVDDAFGFMAGWNFFFFEAFLIPFEITAVTMVCSFWSDKLTEPGPIAGICMACIILYALINILAVGAFGEVEFWLCIGKVFLILMLFGFVFITMVGGNPAGDAYGFRYWSTPGAFATHLSEGSLGRFEGFLSCLWGGAFAIVGPEYITMVSAEAKRPSVYVKNAFKTVYFRFGLFFIGSALAVGIVVPYDNAKLQSVAKGTAGPDGSTASGSPYVIAMGNLGVSVFPHIVNVLLLSSIFSAGNTLFYTATRILHSLAIEGRAPKILGKTTRQGVPIYAFCVVMVFPFLSFLQCSGGSAIVLTWLTNIITAGAIINFAVMSATYIFFYRACKAQGLDRNKLPYTGWFQPYGAWAALIWLLLILFFFGYSSFRNGFNIATFFTNYTMVMLAPVLFLGWKIVKRTSFVKPDEADLVWERPVIAAYEAALTEPIVGFWTEVFWLFGFRRHLRKH